MIREQHLRQTGRAGNIFLDIYPSGKDIVAVLRGGEGQHVGCAVLAVPRESLTGDGSTGCTSSVINVTGHKDEYICRLAAETLCARFSSVTVCTGGFHKDDITADEIEEVMQMVKNMLEQVTYY